jgi:L-ribulose-5-phosphate 3-epimerase
MFCVKDRVVIGIYEKALPRDLSLQQKLSYAKSAEYDFMELSLDESDDRLERLDWDAAKRRSLRESIEDTGINIPSMCLSAHRRFPLGSTNTATRDRGFEIMRKAIELSYDLGIRVIQLAGYDVYYEESTPRTQELFLDGMRKAVQLAAQAQVMIGVEIMDYWIMNSISKFMEYSKEINSPWFTVYPDIGNLSAWGNNVKEELEKGISKIVGIHLKETFPVTPDFPGKFRDVPFGDGCVDFISFFKIIESLNYSGPFLIEMWTENAADPLREIKNARSWIIDKMKEGGICNA